MQTYQSYRRGRTPVGAIVVKLYPAGETVRGYVREIEDIDEEGTAFPSEEMEPEVAFRLAESRRLEDPSRRIFVELAGGAEWDPQWGSLH